jgi:radical SAM superfamily enzyme YgiQ (UPF0313 family)
MLDIIIVSVPGTVSRLPPAAPALLKASVEQHGFSCKTIDYNIRLYSESCYSHDLETYYTTGINQDQLPIAQTLINTWADELAAMPARFIGISVFTYQNRVATQMLCQALRERTQCQIILGGQGLADGGLEGVVSFGQQLCDQGLADYYIRSEGEISLVELLRGNVNWPGINSNTFQQVDDLDSLPYPNYDDYLLDQYSAPRLPVTGSRGCVRSCSFCDIHEHWKFRWRSGQNLANELIHLNQKYHVQDFSFTDSLINGNYKEFNRFIEILANYNQTAAQPITWSSQFIVRSITQSSPHYWQKIAQSGGRELAIGVETGSDRVRKHMNKQFTNQELDHAMSMMHQHGITCVFLMIFGYPTETEQDFQDTLDMFDRYAKYKDIVVNIEFGSTLGILPGTPLYRHAQEWHIELDKYENNWIALDNPDLTLETRLARRQQAIAHAQHLGYQFTTSAAEHMLKIIKNNMDMFNKRNLIKKKFLFKQTRQE